LKTALGESEGYGPPEVDEHPESRPPAEEPPVAPAGDVVTTDQEIDGYRVVRAIVCGEVAASRVVARDTKTYFGVLLDDNNRKPIARLWFNRSKKYLGVFDENKVETRIPIAAVEDIYQHADLLRATVSRYLNGTVLADSPVPATLVEAIEPV
jgi:hypothetical protein